MEVNKIYNGDSKSVLETFFDNTFDSYVSDPPYGLKFMGKHWDYDVPSVSVFKEMFRTLKPGGYILIACGTRTQHRMAVNIEDAGFEIRDNISYFYDGSHEVNDFIHSLTEEQQRAFAKITNEAEPAVINWLYGSGFPKSLDVSKAIDKQAGVERELTGGYTKRHGGKADNKVMGKFVSKNYDEQSGKVFETTPSTDAAKQWEGWGTALKPAQEFWTLARKPLSEKTVAENVLKYGTGGINIDAARIETDEVIEKGSSGRAGTSTFIANETTHNQKEFNNNGRFPSNVILDEFMGQELDKMTGNLISGNGAIRTQQTTIEQKFKGINPQGIEVSYDDKGGASRYFYCAKADNFQRNKGLKGFELKEGIRTNAPRDNEDIKTPERKNHHPTVKPIELMRYLVKLITPKGGLTCDPFCGSGTTLIAAKLEFINYIGIEREKEYCEISEARIAAWNPDKYKEQTLFD